MKTIPIFILAIFFSYNGYAQETKLTNQQAREILSSKSVSYPFRYAVIGDLHNTTSISQKFDSILEEIKNNNNLISFIIVCGDFVDYGYQNYFSAYRDFINPWMRDNNIAVFTLPGNHDLDGSGLAYYLNYIDNDFDTYFNFGNSRFILLNNNRHIDDNNSPYHYQIDDSQINKVDKWLLSAPARRFVFTHVPIHSPYFTSSYNTIGANINCINPYPYNNPNLFSQKGFRELHELFKKHNVTAAFNGHDHYIHNYLMQNIESINYFTTGGGGEGVEHRCPSCPFPDYRPSENRLFDSHWLEVEVNLNYSTNVMMHILGVESGEEEDEDIIPGTNYYPADFDVVIPQKTVESTYHTTRGWDKIWSDYQGEMIPNHDPPIMPENYQGNINSWKIMDYQKFYPGDYNGDGMEELLCVRSNEDPGWISMKRYVNDNWEWYWSSGGTPHMMTPYRNYLYIGDFDGDNKDEALGIGPSWQTMFHFENSAWIWGWSTGGSGYIGTWHVSSTDKYYIGDFNGDEKDELLCANTAGLVSLYSFSNNSWSQIWSNSGSRSAGSYIYDYRNNLNVGDFDGDGKDEILGASSYGLKIFKFHNNNFIQLWYQNSTSSLWIYRNDLIIADFDGDAKDEILGKDTWITKFDYNNGSLYWEWSSYGLGYLCDWNISAANTYYFPIRNAINQPDFLFVAKKNCVNYSASMYNYWNIYNDNFNFSITSSNALVQNNWNVQGCDGADLSYLIYVPETKNVTLSTCNANTNFDTKIEIYNQNGSTTNKYNDDNTSCGYYFPSTIKTGGEGYPSTINTQLTKGYYFVVVDGYCGVTGNFKLSVTGSSALKNATTNNESISYTEQLTNTENDENVLNSKDIQVFPNPSNTYFNIALPDEKKYTISIFDLSGKIIHTFQNAEQNMYVDCSNFNAGVYLIKVSNATEIYHKRIFINK